METNNATLVQAGNLSDDEVCEMLLGVGCEGGL